LLVHRTPPTFDEDDGSGAHRRGALTGIAMMMK
jgi:hypothetical protein